MAEDGFSLTFVTVNYCCLGYSNRHFILIHIFLIQKYNKIENKTQIISLSYIIEQKHIFEVCFNMTGVDDPFYWIDSFNPLCLGEDEGKNDTLIH
jgi:hypothetical protein